MPTTTNSFDYLVTTNFQTLFLTEELYSVCIASYQLPSFVASADLGITLLFRNHLRMLLNSGLLPIISLFALPSMSYC